MQQYDRATAVKWIRAVAFDRPLKHAEQISHSLAPCSNLLFKCFERNNKNVQIIRNFANSQVACLLKSFH